MSLEAAKQTIRQKMAILQTALDALNAVDAAEGFSPAYSAPRPAKSAGGTGQRRPMSNEAKERMRQAQQRRWAAIRNPGPAPETTINPAAAQSAEALAADQVSEPIPDLTQEELDKAVATAATVRPAGRSPKKGPAKKK